MKARKPRILIYRLGSLGDTVLALPCFNHIRKLYPGAEITLLTNKPVATKAAPLEAVLGKDYFFDRVLAYPVGTRNARTLFSLMAAIRSHQIDHVINLMPSRSLMATLRDKIFFTLAGIKKHTGFMVGKNEKEAVLSDGAFHEWEARRLARLLKDTGRIDLDDDSSWDMHLTVTEKNEASAILTEAGITSPFLVISLGTKNPANHWGDDNWHVLISRLGSLLPGWALLVIGAAEEYGAAASCLKHWEYKGLNLCGKISPRVSAAILKKASLFIGHDSGPLHLAGCAGVPSVGIYSARDLPGQWFPRGKDNILLYHLTECAGCGLHTCVQFNNKCIRAVSVEEVMHAAARLLRQPIEL